MVVVLVDGDVGGISWLWWCLKAVVVYGGSDGSRCSSGARWL